MQCRGGRREGDVRREGERCREALREGVSHSCDGYPWLGLGLGLGYTHGCEYDQKVSTKIIYRESIYTSVVGLVNYLWRRLFRLFRGGGWSSLPTGVVVVDTRFFHLFAPLVVFSHQALEAFDLLFGGANAVPHIRFYVTRSGQEEEKKNEG